MAVSNLPTIVNSSSTSSLALTQGVSTGDEPEFLDDVDQVVSGESSEDADLGRDVGVMEDCRWRKPRDVACVRGDP